MNAPVIRSLVLKDWFLMRRPLAFYLVAAAVALAMCGSGSLLAFDAGAILLITVMISMAIHIVMQTIANERVEKTLAFVMSLPISAMDYTSAKLIANGALFLVPWAIVTAGAAGLIAFVGDLPNGLIPWAVAVMLELAVSYFFLVGVSLVSESMPWTIVGMVVGNLGFQAFLFYVSNIPVVAHQMKGEAIVWNGPIATILLLEIAAIVALLGSTYWAQSRKRDFI
jgi:ABC-type transport system involved in multi-copper enzyme maturation permease subunit